MIPQSLGAGLARAIVAGTCAHEATEAAVERRQIVEAGIVGDRRNGVVASPQPHGGAMQSRMQYELVRRHADHLPERAQKMIRAQARVAREFGQRQSFVGVLLDPPRRRAAALMRCSSR